jgi:hypothetical protein
MVSSTGTLQLAIGAVVFVHLSCDRSAGSHSRRAKCYHHCKVEETPVSQMTKSSVMILPSRCYLGKLFVASILRGCEVNVCIGTLADSCHGRVVIHVARESHVRSCGEYCSQCLCSLGYNVIRLGPAFPQVHQWRVLKRLNNLIYLP